MEKYYLFGSYLNCRGVLAFLGTENVVSIIDNDTKKQGKYIEGIEIISLDEYVKRGDSKKIFITSYYKADEIILGLKERNITNYQKCPWMQLGYFSNCAEIVDALDLKKENVIAFYDKNPIAEAIAKYLLTLNQDKKIMYFADEDTVEIPEGVPVVVTIPEEKEKKKKLIDKYGKERIYDVEAVFLEKYRFKNPNLEKFKGIHKGKRCFIIGNGPSLKIEDLDLLYKNKEICFAGNAIYYIYNQTEWRPNYYVSVDSLFLNTHYEAIKAMEGIRFIRHHNGTNWEWNDENVYEFGGLSHLPDQYQFSFDFVDGLYGGYTLVFEAIQIATYMGFTEIYLLGTDMSSGTTEDTDHFYEGKSSIKYDHGTISRKDMRKSTGVAGEILGKKGIVLMNATRGGELEEIARVDFEKLF